MCWKIFFFLDNNDLAKYGPHLAIDDVMHSTADSFGFFQPFSDSKHEWIQIDFGFKWAVKYIYVAFRRDKGRNTHADRRRDIEVIIFILKYTAVWTRLLSLNDLLLLVIR